MQPKIIHDGFEWIPLHEIHGMPPRKPDFRTPLLRIVRQSIPEEGSELLLVNGSGAPIQSITVFKVGSFTADGNVIVLENDTGFAYIDVPHGSAVKIDQFDDYYDLDYIIGFRIEVESEKLGRLLVNCFGNKGGMRDHVLLWDTWEAGRGIGISKLDESDE
ncbi:MAG: hypothetical protein GX665_03045 [Gammaproteobacteria bacterium]|nr:hypothetical protein [Gammaproteobacteria bacterium]